MKKLYFLLLCSSICVSQTQIGLDIDGENAYDLSGRCISLSADGNMLAIGATDNDGNGSSSGHVRVYKNISGTWSQVGAAINGEVAGDYSGQSVSLSYDGSVLAIGAKGNGGNGSSSGHVRVYENISGVWSQVGTDINGEVAYDYSGHSVSLSSDGSVLAIGANNNDGNGTNSGHVRVYKNIFGTWSQVGADINGEAAFDYSGWSVTLSADGSVLAIGAPFNNGNGTDSGHVRVYKNILGAWNQVGTDINGEAADDISGRNVSLSSDGNVLAIGAIGNDGNGSISGHVRVYKNISGVWSQVGTDIDGEATNDNSGWSVNLSSDGNVLAIGANGNGSNSGHVSVYKNISGVWSQAGTNINGEAIGDYSGECVSLSSDGSVLAIGAHNNDGNGISSGHVRVYNLSAVLRNDPFVLQNFSIFPNPTSYFVTILLKENLQLEKVNIYNTLGQLIKTEKNILISVENLTKGTYYFELFTNKGKATKTIIVE